MMPAALHAVWNAIREAMAARAQGPR